MKHICFLCFLVLPCRIKMLPAQIKPRVIETAITLHSETGDIFGSLLLPDSAFAGPVALIIAGSGPTDRDGNPAGMKNDGLKQLAYSLANAGIASVRYDKRGVAASMGAMKKEDELRFEDYITDAESWIDLIKKDKRFTKITVVGHSEGSLIGMIAARKADKFVSIAGAGRPASVVLREQLNNQPQAVKDMAFPVLDSLAAGHLAENVNPLLNSIFRKKVQPYLVSWFKYDPQQEIKKLVIPVLIVQGTNDLQVSTADADLLAKANPRAALLTIKNMNHVLKIVATDRESNLKAYNDPTLQVPAELTTGIIDFIQKN